MLKQVSIFAQNKSGSTFAIMDTLATANINVRAMTIADTAEFGIIRLIVSDAAKALEVLRQNGFTANTTDIIGFTVEDESGKLCDVLRLLGEEGISFEYSYSLMGKKQGEADIAMRVKDKDLDKAMAILSKAGVKLLTQEDVL